MRDSQIGEALVTALPELAADLEDYVAEWAGGPERPGPYSLSSDVLCPSLQRWLESGHSSDQLRRALVLLDQLAQDPNPEIRFWVADIATWLIQEPRWLQAARPFLGRHFGRLVRRAWYEAFGTAVWQRWLPPWW